MVEIFLVNQKMTIIIKGIHKLWTLKSKIVIPIEQIVGVRINQEIKKPEGWRVAGIRIPKLIAAGTYKSVGEKAFWDVVNLDKSIIIDLRDNDYKQLILEVQNPETIVKEIYNKIEVNKL